MSDMYWSGTLLMQRVHGAKANTPDRVVLSVWRRQGENTYSITHGGRGAPKHTDTGQMDINDAKRVAYTIARLEA